MGEPPTSGNRGLTGQVAIVTGGTVGIGRATCLCLANAGAHVVVVGRTPSRIAETIEELAQRGSTGSTLGLALDVRREEDMEELARRAVDRFGRIDILIASAGILRARGNSLKTMVQMSVEEWHDVLDTNLTGLFLSNRAVLPTMISQRSGQIINVSSTSGRKGYAFDTAYCASKYGIIGLSEALAEEVRPYGVRVQTVLPGAIATPMWDQNGPLRRPDYALPAERVADLILYMATLPEDTMLLGPTIEPFRRSMGTGWLGQTLARGMEPSSELAGSGAP